jgi:predicted metalloprotease
MKVRRAFQLVSAAVFTVAMAGAALVIGQSHPVDRSPGVRLAVGQVVQISPVPGSCPVIGDLEDKFGGNDNNMIAYLQCVVPDVDQWLSDFYPGLPHPSGYFFIPADTQVQTACNRPSNQDSLEYCSADGGVYLGGVAIWTQYNNFGDGAPVAIIAHELTHHIQAMLQMPGSQTPNGQVRYENQADCGAGAFMAYSRNRGQLALDDISDLTGSLIQAGQAEGPDRDHGTPLERYQAFRRSYDTTQPVPLWECNQFVPEMPLRA